MSADDHDGTGTGVNGSNANADGGVKDEAADREAGHGRSVSETSACLAGVTSSNTPPSNSNSQPFKGGEDWFEWSAHVDWTSSWSSLRPELERAKGAAQDQQSCKQSSADMMCFGGSSALVSPTGSKRGRKSKGAYVAYTLNVDGMVIQIANNPTGFGVSPNVYVRADGRMCLMLGASNALDYARNVITLAGGKILMEKLSRVDLCLDLPDIPITEFEVAYHEHRCICRPRGRGCHEGIGTTLYWGKRPLLLRIYDKWMETLVHGDSFKTMLMVQRRWGGQPDCATRVEFELAREALKERGIDSPDDYFKKRADLAAYLCNEWFRICTGAVDRTNTTRADIHPLWTQITDGFLAWAGSPAGESLDPLVRRGCDVRQLLKQAVGVLITAAVIQGRTFVSGESFEEYVAVQIRCILRDMNLAAEIARRAVKYPESVRT